MRNAIGFCQAGNHVVKGEHYSNGFSGGTYNRCPKHHCMLSGILDITLDVPKNAVFEVSTDELQKQINRQLKVEVV